MNKRVCSTILLLFITLVSINSFAVPVIIPAAPEINAKSYVLIDYNSGKVIASKNPDEKLPPASLTKIMTAYIAASEIAAGHIHLDDMVTVSEKAWKMEGSRMFIEVNSKVSVRDLLKGIVIQSGNDASVAMAEHISGDESVFAQVMNQTAKRLGMKNSHFMNATGLPHPDHYTTANDLAILARALIHDFPDEYKIHAQKEFVYNNIKQQNRNRLLWLDDTVDGIKTGHTDAAGYCLVTSALRDGMRLIAVVMGTDSDKARTVANQTLLNYGFRYFETHKLYSSNDNVTSVKVWKGQQDSVNLGLQKDLYVTTARGKFDSLTKDFSIPEPVLAPLKQDQQLGELTVKEGDKQILKTPLYAKQTIAAGGLFKRTADRIRLIFE